MDVVVNQSGVTIITTGDITDNVWHEYCAWCENRLGEEGINIGPDRWKWDFDYDNGDEFHFLNPEDATMFLLKWS